MSAQLQQPRRTYSSGQKEMDEQEMGAQLRRSPARTGGIKYGSGKFANVELVPQPSDLPEDPLNWSSRKKNLHFATLLMTAGTLGTLKTMLVTVNAVVATELNVSYGAAVALTGLPVIIGAGFAVKSKILAQSVGKRGIQLGSAIMMLLAAVWNMHVIGNYAEFMVTRIFQGIGWGMFEGLIAESISDIYFEHERQSKTAIYNAVSVFFTWGSPILGGYLSQNSQSFRNEIMILNIIQSFAIVFLIFLSPESTFHREAAQFTTSPPRNMGWKGYLQTLKPTGPHSTRKFEKSSAIRTLKALCAPSAILTTLLTAPLLGTAFGIAHSLSLLFAAMPTFLFPSRLGYIFILPLIFSLISFSATQFLTSKRNLTLPSSIMGLLLAVAGLLSFGLYTTSSLDTTDAATSVFSSSVTQSISLEAVSAFFGLLVSGAVALSLSGSAYLSRSSPSSSADIEVSDAHTFLQEFLIGIWTMATPIWIEGFGMTMVMDASNDKWMGLRNMSIALAVVGVLVSSTVAAGLWVRGKEWKVVDRRVLGERRENGNEVSMGGWEKGESGFFEG